MTMKMGRMRNTYAATAQGKPPKRDFYWQAVFTLIIFASMIVTSYFFMNTAIRRQLVQNSEATLDLAMSKMETELRGPETTLRTFAEVVRQSIVSGGGVDDLRELLRSFNSHLLFYSEDGTTPLVLFGIFYAFGSEPVFLHNDGWTPFVGYDAQSRQWYRAATAGGGSPTRSGLYLDLSVEQYVFAIAQTIHDESGQLLGVVSLHVPIDIVGKIVLKEAAEQGGFGMILGNDLMVHAHTNRNFVGMKVPDPELPFSIFYDDLIQGKDVVERPIINFAGVEALAFLRKTQDGWYYGTVVPSTPYYKSITSISYALLALGIAAAVFLILVLYIAEARRSRASTLTSVLNQMSELFIKQNGKTFEEMMNEGGKLLADLASLDRFSLIRNTIVDGALYMSQIYRWEKASGGTTEPNEDFVHVAYSRIAPVWESMFKEGRSLSGPIRSMPERESALLKSVGARSAFIAPIHINGEPWGFALFEDHKRERAFDGDLEGTMQSAAFLFVNAIIRFELASLVASERDHTQEIVDAAPIGLNVWDDNYNIIGCNDAVETIFGCTKQYYLEHFSEFSPEYQPSGVKSIAEVRELMDRAYKGEKIVLEWMHRSASGEPIPCEITMTRLAYNDKNVVLVYLYDLRNMKKMEAAVLDAEQMLALIDAAPLGCILIDENLNVLTGNKTALELFKLSQKDDIKRLFIDFVPKYQPNGNNSKEVAHKVIQDVFDKGHIFYPDWTHKTTSGELLPCEVTIVRVKYGDSDVAAAYIRDMRAVRAAEAKLREVEERMLLMLNATPLACSLLDKNYECLDCNEEAVKLFGTSTKQEYLDTYRDFWPQFQPDGRDSFEEGVKLIRHTFEHGYLCFEWLYVIGNEPVPCEVTLVRVEYGSEHILAAYTRDLRREKVAEAKAREADERALLMLENTPLIVMVWDENIQILDCNQEAVRILGLPSKKEYVENFYKLMPEYQPCGEASSEKAQKAISQAFSEGSSRIEFTMIHHTGEAIPFEVTLFRIRYKDKDTVVSYGQDLRERNAAIAKMREADEKAREADEWSMLMLDAMPLGSGIWTKDGKMAVCNEEAARLFDLENKNEFIERFGELSPDYQPDGRPSLETAIGYVGKAFEEGYCRFEWTHKKLNGEPLPVEVFLIRAKYRDDYRVIGYFRDLRELKESIEKMREADVRAQLMLEEAPMTIMLWDKDANILDCNQVAVRTFGVSYKEEYIRKFIEWAPQYQPNGVASIEIIQKELAKVFETGSSRFDWTHHHGVTGELIPFEITWVRVVYKGEYVALSYAQDLRERKKMEEEAKKAYEEAKKAYDEAMKAYAAAESALEAKNLFVANMNHEMRTPMNVIVGLTELLLDEEDVTATVKEMLNKINTAGTTLMGLISDVLDISKVDAGKMELAPVRYDMASFLNDIVTLNVIRIEEKPIVFNLDISEDLPRTLHGDDLRVKQILNNLLSNAFKYTKAGSVTLNVECKRDGDIVWTSFCVTDTGIGIRSQDIGRLFTEYHQVDAKANRRIEGTGLGLSITKRIVELMGGQVSVESKYGRGTTFHVRIKQEFVSSETIGKENAENLRSFQYLDKKKQASKKFARADLSYARALVVDDFSTNLDVAAGMLRKYKMQVDCVTSGQAAIDLITAKTPVYDAVFMDHMMPEMDGIEAVQAIRALDDEYAKNIPIIALTANAVAGNEQMFLENGFDAFLPKPFNVVALDAVIQRWVRDKSKE